MREFPGFWCGAPLDLQTWMSYGLSMGTHENMHTGQLVTFKRGDEANTELEGIISRVWRDGRTITIKVEGPIAGTYQTWVRYAANVTVWGR